MRAVRLFLLAAVSVIIVPACGNSNSESGILLSFSSASFTAPEGGAAPPDRMLLLTGAERLLFGRIQWTAVSDQPWLSVTPGSGTLLEGESLPVSIRVDPALQLGGWIGATSVVNAPEAREDHDAVWAGNRMILWGGEHGGLLNTGGRYDPVLNQWTGSTATLGAPSPRTLHTTVWTGSEMLVWGGSTGSQPAPASTYYGEGYRYIPATDSWPGSIAAAGAPTPRSLHTAVWTGSRMIVWGGFDGAGLVNTGGIYDPAADFWVGSTSTTNVPGPRLHHVAVWTGTEMIVWGGQGTSGDTIDGGRYDPLADRWTPMSTANAPTARQAATAVWTGREMVVWGGSVLNGSRGAVDSGGRYNPAMDSWVAATPTVGAPTARQSHSAVWTGSRMIVSHGASPAAGYFDGGGIYQPPIPAIGVHTGTITLIPAIGPSMTILVTLTVTP